MGQTLFIKVTVSQYYDPVSGALGGNCLFVADQETSLYENSANFNYGTVSNPSNTPLPIFVTDAEAIAYYAPLICPGIVAQANTDFPTTEYTSYNVQTVDYQVLSYLQANYVPNSTTINGQPLTGNITILVSQSGYSGTGASAPTAITNPIPVFLTGTIASGQAVFNLTADGTSTGAALFPNGPLTNSVNVSVNNSANVFTASWAWSNSNKTLTVTVNEAAPTGVLSLLSLNLLGAPSAAPNGTVVNVTVWGN